MPIREGINISYSKLINKGKCNIFVEPTVLLDAMFWLMVTLTVLVPFTYGTFVEGLPYSMRLAAGTLVLIGTLIVYKLIGEGGRDSE